LTNFSISGQVGLGDGSGSLKKVNNNWEFNQAFSVVKGSHEIKVGFDWRSLRFAFYSPGFPSGTLLSAAPIPVMAWPTSYTDVPLVQNST